MKRVLRFAPVLAIVLALAGAGIACTSSPKSTLDESPVRAYADPATETTLQGLSEKNLAKYVQYGSVEFKAAVTQETLDKTAAQIDGQLGAYRSKEFLRIEEDQGYVMVHYRATYARGEVGVRMVFDSDQHVAGQWFE